MGDGEMEEPKSVYSRIAFEIAKLVEGGLRGDRDKVAAYASQIAARLEQVGESKAAKRILLAVSERSARTATAARGDIQQIVPVPVDADSRLPVADVEMVEDDVFLILNTAAEQMVARLVNCFQNLDQLAKHGVGITPTLLVYGPPGTGKTQLARFIAKQAHLPLLTARSDALISSYLGSTAKNVRALFDHANARPCVLFLDEFDSIAKMRDDQHELGELKRVVISLLQNIDALSKDHIVVAATNHEHLLDPAIWRRFAYKLELSNPDKDQRIAMLRSFLGAFGDPKTIDIIADLTKDMSGAQLQHISSEAIRDTLLEDGGATKVSLFTITKISIEQIAHKQLLDPEEKTRIIMEKCGDAFSGAVLGAMTGVSQPTAWRNAKKMEIELARDDKDRRAG
jgi:SpoVK/Ycf46/Vps4 family AAA+-type ATPase